MGQPFIGREALDAGRLTSHRLRTNQVISSPGSTSRQTPRSRHWRRRALHTCGRGAAVSSPTDRAVAAIDSLARAARLELTQVAPLVERYRGRNGIRRARATLELVDAGAESPRETWLRLLIIRSGLPRPRTQIPVLDEYRQIVARVDMGWEECTGSARRSLAAP